MLKKIEEILKSKKLSGYRANKIGMEGGEHVQALEMAWEKHFKVKNAIAVNSATSGIWCALAAFLNGVEYNPYNRHNNTDEVIVTPYSMTCSASLPVMFGAMPIFADIEKDYFCLNPKSIQRKITTKTKGIIVVDLFGMPYDPAIDQIAKDNNLWIIEDAAQAIGATRKGKFAGTLGDIGVYSLNQHKQLSCGEGGVIVTDNDELALKLRMLINHSESISNETNVNITLCGMNMRMTEITAIIALEELKNIKSRLKPYIDNATDFDIPLRAQCKSSYYKYASWAKSKNVEKYDVQKGYITPLYKLPYFRWLGYNQNICPICEYVENNIYISALRR